MELAQGQGQVVPYPETGGWEAGSLGMRSGAQGYCLQVPRELGSSRPCKRVALGVQGTLGGWECCGMACPCSCTPSRYLLFDLI